MRVATVRTGDTLTAARIGGDRAGLVDAVDAHRRRNRPRDIGETDAGTAHRARDSPTPAHILRIGLNYRGHIREPQLPYLEYPTYSPPSSPQPRPAHGTPSPCPASATTSTGRRNWRSSSDVANEVRRRGSWGTPASRVPRSASMAGQSTRG